MDMLCDVWGLGVERREFIQIKLGWKHGISIELIFVQSLMLSMTSNALQWSNHLLCAAIALGKSQKSYFFDGPATKALTPRGKWPSEPNNNKS